MTTIQTLLFLLYNAISAQAYLAFDRRIWELSRLLSAAIYIAIAAIVLFFCYAIFKQKRRR
jgi:multisubunit Na+/H+ antiporter MnhB subunit